LGKEPTEKTITERSKKARGGGRRHVARLDQGRRGKLRNDAAPSFLYSATTFLDITHLARKNF